MLAFAFITAIAYVYFTLESEYHKKIQLLPDPTAVNLVVCAADDFTWADDPFFSQPFPKEFKAMIENENNKYNDNLNNDPITISLQITEDRITKLAAPGVVLDGLAANAKSAEQVFMEIDSFIIGNKKYKQALAVVLRSYLQPTHTRSHMLVVGPSGSGKTYLIERFLPTVGIPFTIIDGASLVPSAYRGLTIADALSGFYSNLNSTDRAVVVLDEFDKICEHANGDDKFKSHGLQSELLSWIQGKQEGNINTKNTLWILLGAFAYTNEMQSQNKNLKKRDLLKYGFKNELLGRIAKIAWTEAPTLEDVLLRLLHDQDFQQFQLEMNALGYELQFPDDALYSIGNLLRDPAFGMRTIATLLTNLKENIIFNNQCGVISVNPEMIEEAVNV